eukprot:m.196642 g.196642  ORF g.196642 m.196642 type:complete len:84 (-) comp13678_c2_seq2:86-337(-)
MCRCRLPRRLLSGGDCRGTTQRVGDTSSEEGARKDHRQGIECAFDTTEAVTGEHTDTNKECDRNTLRVRPRLVTTSPPLVIAM